MSRIINAAACDNDDSIETADNLQPRSRPMSRSTDLRFPVNASKAMGNEVVKEHTSTTPPPTTVQASTSPDSDEDPTSSETQSASSRSIISEPKLAKWLFGIAYPGEVGQGTKFRALAKRIEAGRGRITIPDDIDRTFKQAIEDRRCMLRYWKHVKDGTAFEERMEKCQEILDG